MNYDNCLGLKNTRQYASRTFTEIINYKISFRASFFLDKVFLGTGYVLERNFNVTRSHTLSDEISPNEKGKRWTTSRTTISPSSLIN